MGTIESSLILIFKFLGNFTTQITIGTLLFCAGMKKRPHFKWRLLVFLPFCLIPVFTTNVIGSSFYQLPYFFVGWFAYIFTALVICASLLTLFCFKAPYLQILYYCAASHILQNLSYMARSILEETLIPSDRGLLFRFVAFLLDLAIWYLAYRILVSRISREQVEVKSTTLIVFVLAATVIVNIFYYWTYMFGYLNLATLIYEAICCILLLSIQFSIFDLSKRKMESEVMARYYGAMERQQALSKENIDIINRKCHDLKYQISMLRQENCLLSRDDVLAEIEGAVEIYDSIVKTGNEVLDTILTEKSLLCEQYKINMTLIADGEKLQFMEASDLYSLFGNALDNAIECVRQEDIENRIICLNIGQRGGLLSVALDNYCSKQLRFENGMPITTKEDNSYHGFGMQSIQYIVKKYGGTLSVRQELDVKRFVLYISFPLGTIHD